MSTWVFNDWAGRIYDDPAVGTVKPGDTIEADSPPDNQFWTLQPQGEDVLLNLSESVSENVDISGQNDGSAQVPTNNEDAAAPEGE